MRLVITLRKEVADEQEASNLYEVVKQWLVNKPDIKVSGQVSSDLETIPPPE